MFGPAWHCLTQFDVQADSVLQMVLDLGRYLDNNPIPDHEDIVNIIKEIVGTIVTSVNGKTGEVNLKLSDVTGTDSWPVWILTNAEYGEITDATMLDAYDNDGFRLLYVTAGEDPEKEPAFLMIPGRTFNPDGITRYIFTGGGGSGGGAVQSVNGKVGTVVLTAADVGALPDTYVPPAPPVTSVNTKTGEVVLSASDVGAATPADVSAVDAKVDAKYGPDNAPPYPVTSVNGTTGAITNLTTSSFDGTNYVFKAYGAPAGVRMLGTVDGRVYASKADGTNIQMYSEINPPPYPVTSVNGQTGAVGGFATSENTSWGTTEFKGAVKIGGRGIAVTSGGVIYGIPDAAAGIAQYSAAYPPPIIDSSSDTGFFIKSNTDKPNLYFGNIIAEFSGEDIVYRFSVPNTTAVFGVISATFIGANIPVGKCTTNGNVVSIKPANSDAPGVGSPQYITYLVFGA